MTPLPAQALDRGDSALGPAFAFLAACAFALGTVLQQKGTLGTTSGSGDSHWLIQILHEPVWLAGLLLQASGWVLQAVALDKGPLMAVQAITTLSLVIALPFGAWLTGQHIDRTVVLGALAVVAGIVVFLSVGSPHGGTTHPSARTWWIACLVTGVLVLVMAGLGRTRHGAVRALLFGAAAGFGFALQTAVTKDFVTEIGGGVLALGRLVRLRPRRLGRDRVRPSAVRPQDRRPGPGDGIQQRRHLVRGDHPRGCRLRRDTEPWRRSRGAGHHRAGPGHRRRRSAGPGPRTRRRRDGTKSRRPRSGAGAMMPPRWWSLPPDPVSGQRPEARRRAGNRGTR